MKKYLLSFLFSVLFFVRVKAQAYHPMFLDSGKWNIISSYEDFTYPTPNWLQETHTNKMKSKDSIYKSQHYRIVDDGTLWREDTLLHKVWGLNHIHQSLNLGR